MVIPSLQAFDPSQWESIHSAFEHAPAWDLGQAWKETPEKNFRSGRVRVAWQGDAVLILAQLVDDCLFTKMTADQQNAWCLGDVFEIFIRDAARENYLELHVVPNGHRLQLGFPGADAIARIRAKEFSLDSCRVEKSLFDSSVRAVPTGWEVFVRLPAASLGSQMADLQKSGLLASFSRYDYDDQGSEPVLSSTSAHKVLNFHRQEEWKTITLTAPR